MNRQHVGNHEDLFKMFIYCYVNPGMFKLTDIISQEMFDLLTSWRQEFIDLFPREVQLESLVGTLGEDLVLHISKTRTRWVMFGARVKITILEE